MSVNSSPFGPKGQWELATGAPAVGNQLFFYVAGSVNTKQTTYTDSTGTVANTNPIILNSLGQPPNEIWFTAGQSYKVVFAPSTDTDPPTSPIWTIDNLRGINDSSITIDQWVASGLTPTFVNATQFTVLGDQTSIFAVGRRLKLTVTAGTVYGRISVSAFGALTTVTVVLDGAGVLDAGLSAVSYGLLTPDNHSFPPTLVQAGSNTTITYDSAGRVVVNSSHSSIYPVTASIGDNALTLTLNPCILDFRDATIGSGTVNTRTVSAAISTTISSGSTGGTVSATPARIWIAAIDFGGTVELAWINTQLGNGQIAPVNESMLITTIAEGGAGAADSAGIWYSTTARSNVPFVLVGYAECTEAPAGTWATAPAVIRGVGAGTRKPGELIQTVRGINSTASTGSTIIPQDNTIPQITEGDEIVTVAITPTSAINILNIDYSGMMNAATNTVLTTALFQDATANALTLLACRMHIQGDDPGMNTGTHSMRSATVAATTFRVRAGPSGASTTYINRTQTYATCYGGVAKCVIEVSEVMA